MIYLHTLGEALLRVGDKEIRPTAPMLFAALLYLGIERGRRVPRAALQEMLFPNTDERSGAHSLRQLLYKLRRFGVPLECTSSSVLLPAQQTNLDLSDLSAESLDATTLARMSSGFLPHYAPSISDPFSVWVQNQRDVAHGAARRVLSAKLVALRAKPNGTDAEEVARTLLRFDPYNEEATLTVAEAKALAGSKKDAVELLNAYLKEIGDAGRELRVPASLLKNRISESRSDAVIPSKSPPLVGRDEELGVLLSRLDRMRRKDRSVAVVWGEPGIGKTRLVEEFRAVAQLRGVTMVQASCHQHDQKRPFAAVAELVPQLLDSPGGLGVAPEAITYLQRLTTRVTDVSLAHLGAAELGAIAIAIEDAVVDLVEAVQGETPLVIVFEDCQWLDDGSRSIIKNVLGRTETGRVLFVLTSRVRMDASSLSGRHESVVPIHVEPLAVAPTAQLVGALLSENAGSPSEELVQWFWTTSGGNPYFVRLLAEDYALTGSIKSVPRTVRELIAARLNGLAQAKLLLLAAIGVLGRNCTPARLQASTDLATMELLTTLDDLATEGFIRTDVATIRLAHDLLAESLVSAVTPAARRLLHLRAAQELASEAQEGVNPQILWDCAVHWHEAGESHRAIELFRSCAAHVLAIGQPEAAHSLLAEARKLASNLPILPDVLGELMNAAYFASEWQLVADLAIERRKALDRFRPGTPVHDDAELTDRLASFSLLRTAATTISDLQSCISEDATPAHKVHAATLLNMLACDFVQPNAARSAYEAVEPLLTDPGVTPFRSVSLRLIYHTSFGDREIARACALEALELSQSLREPTLRLRLAHNVALAFWWLGEPNRAIALYTDLIRLAKQHRLVAWEAELAATLASVFFTQERYDKACHWHEIAEDWLKRTNGRLTPKSAITNRVMYAALAANWTEARALLESAQSNELVVAPRLKAISTGLRVWIDQAADSRILSDHELAAMQELHVQVRTTFNHDHFVAVYVNALIDRGYLQHAREVLEPYLAIYRRDKSPPPPSLVRAQGRAVDRQPDAPDGDRTKARPSAVPRILRSGRP